MRRSIGCKRARRPREEVLASALESWQLPAALGAATRLQAIAWRMADALRHIRNGRASGSYMVEQNFIGTANLYQQPSDAAV
jgi:hypothetical protein